MNGHKAKEIRRELSKLRPYVYGGRYLNDEKMIISPYRQAKKKLIKEMENS